MQKSQQSWVQPASSDTMESEGRQMKLRKIPYSLVEARRKNVLAHAARFCRASARIVYASSFLRFRISLGLNSEPSKPHKKILQTF